MTDLAKLVVSLEAQNTQLLAKLDQSQKATDAWRRKTEKAVSGVANAFKGLVIGTAVIASARALEGAISGAVEKADKLGKSAEKLGVGTEYLSAMQHAAKLADVDAGKLDSSLAKLVKTQVAAAQGGEKQIEAFRLLNVEFADADGKLRKVGPLFDELADRFASMPDGPEKAALAMQVFGKSGTDLIPLLNQGSQGLTRMREEAEKLGIVISGETAKAADHLGDNMDTMKAAFDGVFQKTAQDLMPAMTKLSDQVTAMATDPAFQQDLADSITAIGKAAIGTAHYLIDMGHGLGYLYDEAKEFVGIIDDKDLERQTAKLDRLQKMLAGLEAGPGGAESDFAKQLRTEIALTDERIQAQERLIAAQVRMQQKDWLQPIDMQTLPKRRMEAPTFQPISQQGPERATTDFASRLIAEADQIWSEIEQQMAERSAAFENIEQVKISLLDEEGQALARLQAQYIELDNQVSKAPELAPQVADLKQQLADKFALDQQAAHQRELDDLVSGLETQEAELQSSYERRLADLQAFNAKTIEEQQRVNAAIQSLEDGHSAAVAQLKRDKQNQQLDDLGAFFGNMSSLMQTENTKLFNIGKASAMAEATVKGASIILSAMDTQPYWLGVALAASAAVATGVQIAQISQAQPPSYDVGGLIPAGAIGLVAERGAEFVGPNAQALQEALTKDTVKLSGNMGGLLTGPTLVEGPAHITSRADTAKLLGGDKFAGMFDSGGFIPKGMVGLAGETGTEIASGMNFNFDGSRLETQAEASQRARAQALKIVNLWSSEGIGNYMASEDGEKAILNVLGRNGRKLRAMGVG